MLRLLFCPHLRLHPPILLERRLLLLRRLLPLPLLFLESLHLRLVRLVRLLRLIRLLRLLRLRLLLRGVVHLRAARRSRSRSERLGGNLARLLPGKGPREARGRCGGCLRYRGACRPLLEGGGACLRSLMLRRRTLRRTRAGIPALPRIPWVGGLHPGPRSGRGARCGARGGLCDTAGPPAGCFTPCAAGGRPSRPSS